MELLVNDLSISGQFPDIATFHNAINRIMAIRAIAKQFGRELYCHRNTAHAQVTHNLSMHQAISSLEQNKRRAFMQWLTKHGPFWEDVRKHSPDDYMEHKGEIVTDTAVGEAAHCCHSSIQRSLVSLTPSEWEFSPVTVDWTTSDSILRLDVANFWVKEELETALENAPAEIYTWEDLARVSKVRFTNIIFSDESNDCFQFLQGYPFAPSAANQILNLLKILNDIKICFNEHGERNQEGHRLYREYFTGDKAWFSGSSDTEKRKFEHELKFPHPKINNEYLTCFWHGKVKTPQLRIHFSWPVCANEPLYVVYVGPKITKK